jgi:hypothetical protein
MGVAQYRIVGDVAIGSILYKGMLVEFMIDLADLERVRPYKWHLASNSYLATSIKVSTAGNSVESTNDISGNGPESAPLRKKELYLHNLLLNPGPNQVVYHISKNGLDNRRINLKLAEGTNPAASNLKKKRNVELPPMCGITPESIPRHIWYVQANGYHRDRFAIEFKTEGILWKSTSSKEISLQDKLLQAKYKLAELYQQYPHLDPSKEEELGKEHQASFERILSFQEE